MKKKIWIPIAAAVLLAVLFVPIPSKAHEDGGTREYRALTYKIVDWNKNQDGVSYDRTRLYLLPRNFKSLDELWEEEAICAEYSFSAKIIEKNGSTVTVEPLTERGKSMVGERVSFDISSLEDIGAGVDNRVEVTYTGGVAESYPTQIKAVSWELSKNMRDTAYTDEWLDMNTAEKTDDGYVDVLIQSIYSDCFFAGPVYPMPYEYKFNGVLSDDWCVGDQVSVSYENAYTDGDQWRIEADFISVEPSDFVLEPDVCYKPVIYLYPEKETEVSVKLTLDGRLTCTYPEYGDGWKVTARPDGTLADERGQSYNYLYWEGKTSAQYDLSRGFCVKGEDTAVFLEDALSKLGLDRREANEFIVYWLPLMQDNEYNIISFQTDAYTDSAKLDITPAPDTLIRVFMAWKPSDKYVQTEEQELCAPERCGFTAVEWGGTKLG
ncbi:MAG: hypothetical protein ACI3YE_02840 [Candidatus Avispirillum sp.]